MTSPDPQALRDLADRVEKLTGPCREVDCRIETLAGKRRGEWREVGLPTYDPPRYFSGQPDIDWIGYDLLNLAPAYTASLDAAMALVPENWLIWELTEIAFDGLPGCRLTNVDGADTIVVFGTTNMVTALTTAALRAQAWEIENGK